MTAAESLPGIEAGTERGIDVSAPIRHGLVRYPGNPGVQLRHAEHLARGERLLLLANRKGRQENKECHLASKITG
jgi:hypothetical protein